MKSYSLKLKSSDVNIFFTSDTHYGHTNICKSTSRWSDKSGCRDFKTLDDMNYHLVHQINKYVGHDDILFHLGDWSFGGESNIYNFRNQIVCNNIKLITGNHDGHINSGKYNEFFDTICRYDEVLIDKILLCLMHFPMSEWNDREHNNVIHLHGHTHGSPRLKKISNRFDVGIDNAYKIYGEYKPFSWNEILKNV